MVSGGMLAIFGGPKVWPGLRRGLESVSEGIGKFFRKRQLAEQPVEALKQGLKNLAASIGEFFRRGKPETEPIGTLNPQEKAIHQGVNAKSTSEQISETFQTKEPENIVQEEWVDHDEVICKPYDVEFSPEAIVEPTQDIIKEEGPKIDYTNPQVIRSLKRDDIFQTNKNKFIGQGRDACAYSIPGHPDLVLRIESYPGNIPTWYSLHEEFIPIEYPERLIKADNLGLPVAVALPNEHPLLERLRKEGRSTLKPDEIQSDTYDRKDIYQILWKMDGDHLNDGYKESFLNLCHPEQMRSMFNQLSTQQVLEIDVPNLSDSFKNNQKGNKITRLVGQTQQEFSNKRNGQNILTHEKRLEFLMGKIKSTSAVDVAFMDNYEKFVTQYRDSLNELANLDQDVFDEAIKSLKILHDAKVGVDMTHPRNTFINYNDHKFNFIDFDFSNDQKHPPFEQVLNDFYSVMLGRYNDPKNYVDAEPLMYIVRPRDRDSIKKPIEILQNKMREAIQPHLPGWEPPHNAYLSA